jgi:hypothetical protein
MPNSPRKIEAERAERTDTGSADTERTERTLRGMELVREKEREKMRKWYDDLIKNSRFTHF